MENKKIAFLTIIFPLDDNYLLDFFHSLDNQTFKNFDLIVVNDGYKNFDKIRNKFNNLNIKELNFSDTPAYNRQHGINYIKESGYENIIFGDSDDYFSPNRVEIINKKLNNFDIVVNDISLFNKDGIYSKKYLSNRIKNETIISFDFIKDKNIFGMSNTASKVKLLENIKIPQDIVAIDWYIFSLLLLKTGRTIFTNETQTFYRQHEDNIIGLGRLNKEIFQQGVFIKLKHYELLYKEDKQFKSCFKDMLALRDIISSKEVNLDSLKKIENPFWWEQIKLIEGINENKVKK